jgi:DNA-binding NtrC family response regulator
MQGNTYSCLVAASHANQAVARSVATMLEAIGALHIVVTHLPECEPDCDLYLPVVAPVESEAVLASLTALHRNRPGASAIALSLGLDEPQIACLLEAGACDFLTDPLDPLALSLRVRRTLGLVNQHADTGLRAMLSPKLKDLVGSSPAFMKPLSMLPTLAGYDAGVLILGETGTGKEVFARAIHYSSSRAAGPLVAINCGAVPTDLLESELFGHVRGAYTHAVSARPGLVREAEGGTLFLDEIDSMPLAAQSKLLRFLQEMEYRPVGGDKVLRADVRIIAACNQDLAGMAERGSFRRDLYFRLSVLTVSLPPLRERREDLRELAQHFTEHFCRRAGKAVMQIPDRTLRCMQAYHWPGNVRELRHSIERAVLMGQGMALRAEDLQIPYRELPAAQAEESLGAAKARIVAQFESDYIRRLLASCNGNITHAAQAAGKNRRAFFELMRKYDISPELRGHDSFSH